MYSCRDKKQIVVIVCILLSSTLFSTSVLHAEIIASYTLTNQAICGNNKLIVVSSEKIPALLGYDIKHISLFKQTQQTWQKILFQIDPKDSKGCYIFQKHKKNYYFSDQDELIFNGKDVAHQFNHSLISSSKFLNNNTLIELKIMTHNNTEPMGWIYIALDAKTVDVNIKHKTLLNYNAEHDIIFSKLYKIGFSKKYPFLMDQFHWRLDAPNNWTADLTDTMKIRHKGEFLGLKVRRTQDDYSSKLTAVKEGPLRIIRRTKNHLKVLWKLKAPALYIDYVISEHGFVMDMMIDIPFNLSYFFNDLSTITTMDWNHLTPPKNFIIKATKEYPEMLINGIPSNNKQIFNHIKSNHFSLSDTIGNVNIILDVPEDFLIQAQLYLIDDVNQADPPENDQGQYGNIGFKTTGWENLSSHLYHLKFTVCVAR